MHSIGASIYLEVELENHLKCFGRNQCYPVGTGKGIWWYWATSGSGTGKSVSITMVATVSISSVSIQSTSNTEGLGSMSHSSDTEEMRKYRTHLMLKRINIIRESKSHSCKYCCTFISNTD